jgi:hypothetical protein
MVLANRFDAPWKYAIHEFPMAFMKTLLPGIAGKVDWTRSVRFRDTQLERLFPHGENGDLRADMLLEVPFLGGDEAWVLLHVEVQAQPDPGLALRMYRYHYRIFDKHGRHPLGMVVLADTEPTWRPGPYLHELEGQRVVTEYRTCKLLDMDLGPWISAGNPVAWVIEAHRRAQRTKGDDMARRDAKVTFMRDLAASGMGRDTQARVMRAAHCLLALPEDLEEEVIEKGPDMRPYMSNVIMSTFELVLWKKMSAEARDKGREEGRQEGRQEGRAAATRELLVDLLNQRFGRVGRDLSRQIASISDESELRRLARLAVKVSTLADFGRELKRA